MMMAEEKENGAIKPRTPDRKYLLSELLGSKVFLHDKKIGSLSDVIIVETGKLPEVRYFVVSRPFGDPSLLIPWERVLSLEPQKLLIDIHEIKKFEGTPPAVSYTHLRAHETDS